MQTQKNILIILFISAIALILNACATSLDPAEAFKNETAQQIFQNGEKELRDKNYEKASKRFEALDVQYPYGRNTVIAQLHIIYAYYKMNDYASAESAADRFIHAHPADPHVDYAYYMRGLSNYYQNMGFFERLFATDLATRDLTQIKKSFNDFATLVNVHPQSRYAPSAYQYMIYLRDVLADHELEVANYYYSHEAYVAAANRATMIVRYYQGSPSVPAALAIMVKSYQQLHLTKLAEDTQRIINYNYGSNGSTH
ncbi:hypothetical protein AYO45_03895 [Gammaproteobacteria bacterium SCGC AG-212-F23]|nr:hypothetical protein AYO45_03895 [Gammaproteobacteria bacterium SCGC AG-212-F23]